MKRENIIDILKGIAIIFVVITHSAWSDSERLTYLFPFWISMAVPIFMLISGYVSAKSNHRKSILNLLDMYHPVVILSKLIRYSIPFIIAFLIQNILPVLCGQPIPGVGSLIKSFITGGVGPGSYYFPVLIQLVFLFPLVFYTIDRLGTKGLLLCLVINIAYEYGCVLFQISDALYRLLIPRYLFLIAWGCYIGCGNRINKVVACGMFLLGLIFTYLISYKGITFFVRTDWSSTSYLATLFLLPIFGLLVKLDVSCKPIEIVGKASYNIYLTQMVYYAFNRYIYISGRLLQLSLSVIVCILVGILFYYVETPITKWLVSKLKKRAA